MSEALDRALARQANRYRPEAVQAVVVRNELELRKVVAEFAPERNTRNADVNLRALMEMPSGGVREVTAQLPSRSKRDMLIHGLEMVRRHAQLAIQRGETVTINNRAVPRSNLSSSMGVGWIDNLIKHWFGGERVGTMICWRISGYKYEYDAFTHTLTRERIDGNQTT